MAIPITGFDDHPLQKQEDQNGGYDNHDLEVCQGDAAYVPDLFFDQFRKL